MFKSFFLIILPYSIYGGEAVTPQEIFELFSTFMLKTFLYWTTEIVIIEKYKKIFFSKIVPYILCIKKYI